MTPEATSKGTGLTHTDVLTLAHELRGALTVIAGYSELLKRPLDEDERCAALEGIERAVKRADLLIEHALGGSGSAGVTRLDLAELAERVGEEQRAATGRDIIVTARARPTVSGDADALSRLLGNLIDNAAKYSPADTPVEVLVEAGSGVARVSVLDRGPGIPAHDRARAFQPFERLSAASGIEGTGVGLAVVSQVAAAHGGRTTIEDRRGGGTTLVLELPVAG